MKKITKENLELATKQSKTLREILLFFERNQSSTSYKTLRKYLNEWNIDTSHLLNRSETAKKLYADGELFKRNDNEIFIENSTVSRATVKKRIIDGGLLTYKCEGCGQDENWKGKKMSLILDHKNGVRNDNRLSNLRFLCPNCNATLETHCLGHSGVERKKNKNKKNITKREYQPRVSNRKVIRPSKEELKKLINTFSFCAIGRKYGVSDNAVRKWVKYYMLS
jgi:hypothetical protein